MLGNNGPRPRPWLPWWPSTDIKTRWRLDWITVTMLTFYMTISISQLTENDINNRIHVVGVETMNKQRSFCPHKCSGTLLTQTLVLSAASCTEYENDNNNSAIRTTENVYNYKGTKGPIHSYKLNYTEFEIGDIKVTIDKNN